MSPQLTPVEARVLGALMEKEAATPEYYPLTVNALVNACNQKSNRDPVMNLDADTVTATLDSLRAKGLVRVLTGAGHRTPKYGHRTGETFNFDRREQAILCVLLLRGPQTLGELRGRTERLYSFDDLTSVENVLTRLADRTPPLVTELPRRPGEKEPRHAHLLCGEPEIPDTPPAAPPPSPLSDRITQLEIDLAQLRAEFEAFRKAFE